MSGEFSRMAIDRSSSLRGRAFVLALSAGIVLLLALLGVPGRLNPQVCNNEMLDRGATAWRLGTEPPGLSVGYACEFSYDDGSKELVVATARWPLVVAAVGVGLLIAAAGTWLQSRRPCVSASVP